MTKKARGFLCALMIIGACFPQASGGKDSGDLRKKTSILLNDGKAEESLKAAREALHEAETKHGPMSMQLAEPLMLLAEIHERRQAYQEAAEYLERLRAVQEKNLGPRNSRVSSTISDLIALYEKAGDAQKAESLNEVAYDRWSRQKSVAGPAPAAQETTSPKTHSLKDIESYAKIMVILADYRKKHTYSTEDFFVCGDMVIDVWNILKTHGIHSRIAVGNVEKDIRMGTTDIEYIAKMNHVWLMAEVKANEWVPLEATGGYIVDPNSANHSLYVKGITFDSPKQFKDFTDMRMSFYRTCREANKVVETYNNQYAGRSATPESLEYRGRAMQKHDECKNLADGVLAHLKR